ncbi:MAG TPA: aminodeoxychorismate/anthranilate synthase component II [Longimicrobiales bacterium]|nr:aminodeoxychorismate/anthranilate synthase component II [Longimicrobiales bacterium]
MIFVLDNYDSFTFNLVQLIGTLGAEPVVRRNDEISVDEIAGLAPSHIVISPGPRTPAEAGISIELVQRLGQRTPVLGVCLGHQAIGAAYGARIVRAQRPMHGKVSPITHNGTDLFDGLPSPLRVTRYHSLVIEPSSLPNALIVTAESTDQHGDDEIQAVRHREHPVWGVQFHPESIASDGGREILANFLSK